MRFIYEDGDETIAVHCNYLGWTWYSWYSKKYSFTVEDIENEIIWLINSQKSYNEMREYYVKG